MFLTEKSLVEMFTSHLKSNSSPIATRTFILEFDYVSGRTDVLSLSMNNNIIAFEAKLSNWRKAIHQAWRNTSFANHVYVVLPRKRSSSAIKNSAKFSERGVGLCIVDEESVEVIINGRFNKPIMLWLNNKAMHELTIQSS